ncbi:uncharacterized protein LOC120682195 isoform X4 [Panicum virgatum]|uniref:uncharacterized protein LOC120672686 isoform X5 n=1 Tax=Panicum virgatum TaxID=38727 RepID=UPI0019D59890|nr:uncharacterized protein LOC120672686 isoform X5 [Panicum virgatum]XP_039819926.1 uncharacterized protein LOC120682195 isoform X4 [Panicum virgatum]
MAVWRCFISQTHGWISSGLEEGSSWLQIEWRLPYGAVCLGTIPDRSGESLPSIAIRKGPNLSRMRLPSSLNGDLESVPLRRLAASIHLGLHCCVAVAVFRTGGPVNHHPRRGGRILRQ